MKRDYWRKEKTGKERKIKEEMRQEKTCKGKQKKEKK